MLAIDSNILVYASNPDCPECHKSMEFLESIKERTDVAISEFVLVELYNLLRNPIVMGCVVSPVAAVETIQSYRRHPRWTLLAFPPPSKTIMDEVWQIAAQPDFARRRIFDVRLGIMLRHCGVTEFATRNVKDFQGLGFRRVFDPLA